MIVINSLACLLSWLCLKAQLCTGKKIMANLSGVANNHEWNTAAMDGRCW